MKLAATTNLQDIQDSSLQSKKVEKKAGKRIGFNYIILRSIKESQKNDVMLCIYIKSLLNFGICVIKEGTYGDTKDKQGRDIKDRLLWQKELHELLQNKVHLPHLLGSFEENGNYYLVLERIRGKSLSKLCKENSKDLRESLITGSKTGMTFLNYLAQITSLLEDLHKSDVIRRDVTAANFMITPSGEVAIIDMELSYSLRQKSPSPPFQLGTYGYMSPEQEAMQPPALEQDTFSLAAIILQVWTGDISPSKFNNLSIKDLSDRVYFFIPDKALADTIIAGLHPDPMQRPSLATMGQAITAYRDDLYKRKLRTNSPSAIFPKEEILETIHHAVDSLASPLLADKEKGWFSANSHVAPNPDKTEINKSWYVSFAKGASGVIYLLSKMHSLNINITKTRPYIDIGLSLIETKYIDRINEVNPGLYYGSSGVAAVLSTAIREGLVQHQSLYINWISSLLNKENHLLGIQDGIAGQGLAYAICEPFLHQETATVLQTKYVDRLLGLQDKDGSWIRTVENGKKRATRGLAHGVAGITYFLLEFARSHDHKDALTAAYRGLHWLIKKSISNKRSILWKSSSGKDISPWWNEGAPGIALTFIKAYEVLGEEKYKKYAVGALQNQSKNVIDNNLTQYQGLSGLGEVYLEAFKILKNAEWLERAGWIAQVLMHLKKTHSSNCPYWLVDHERQPVADFMSGNSGVIHFLLRYCFLEKIGLPLLSR